MASLSELRRYLVERLAGRQSFIGQQVVFAIRSSGEISSSERLTDQQLIDHFPQLFLDLVEYFLTEADPSTRKRTIDAALKHGMTRWQQGYELVEVVRELGIVRESILEHGIEKFFEENSQWSRASTMLGDIWPIFLKARPLDLGSATSRISPNSCERAQRSEPHHYFGHDR
jgi:hypothetical protein